MEDDDVRRLVPRNLAKHLAATHARHTPVFVPSLLLHMTKGTRSHTTHTHTCMHTGFVSARLPPQAS